MELLRRFEGLGKHDAALAGGKGASLGEMTQAGIPVPPGFVILAHAFERFIQETDIDVEIDSLLHDVNREEIHTVERASASIQELILNAQMPADIADLVMAEFKKLDAEFVAVRSSATAEDSASAAWAGQLDSFLNTTEETLLKNVQRCWASLFTPRAIFYRFEKELHLTKISVAVVVQKMVASEISGIAFSVHPVTEDYNQLIIEAGYGLGEAIVSGQVTPDSYVVEKEPRRILDINTSTQKRALYRDVSAGTGGGNVWSDIEEPRASAQVLTETQIQELSDIIIRIENHYGFPCDIEWAFEAGKFYIVQSRPITTLTRQDPVAKEPEWHYWGCWKGPALWISAWDFLKGSRVYREMGLEHKGVRGDSMSFDGHYFTLVDDFLAIKNDLILSIEGKSDFLKKYIALCYEEIARFEKLIEKKDVPEFITAMVEQCSCSILTRYIDFALESYVQGRCREHGVSYDELLSYMAPVKKAPSAEYYDGLAAIGEEDAGTYAKKFAWLASDFFTSAPTLTPEKVLEDKKILLRSHTKESQAEMPTALLPLIEAGREVAYLRIYFAELFTKVTFFYREDLTAVAESRGLSIDDLMLCTWKEVLGLLHGEPIPQDLHARKSSFGIVTENGSFMVLGPQEVSAYLNRYRSYIEGDQNTDVVVGTIANKGRVQGVARVVLSASESARVLEGDIIVTSETTPDFVPAMQRAVGFVTNQGGITSHAAIIAREMGKPCIIGTKIGTSVIHDGDLIELDAQKGVVRILERARIKILPEFKKHEYKFVWGNIQTMLTLENNTQAFVDKKDNPWHVERDIVEFMHENRIQTYYSAEDFARSEEVGKMFLDEKAYLAFIDRMETDVRNCFAYYARVREISSFEDLSNEALWALFLEAQEHWQQVIGHFKATQPQGIEALLSVVRSEVTEEELGIVLLSPGLDDANKEMIDWWKVVEAPYSETALLEHAYKYPWIASAHFTHSDVIDSLKGRYDFDKVHGKAPHIGEEKAELVEKQKPILEKYPALLPYVERLQRLSLSRMEIKAAWSGVDFYQIPILTEIARRTSENIVDLNLYYRIAEVKRLLEEGAMLSQVTKDARKQCFVGLIQEGKVYYFEGDEAEEVVRQILGEQHEMEKAGGEVCGTTAYPGLVRGRVQILHANDVQRSRELRESFAQGDILVTEMTQPNIMDIAARAGALVTDEGSLLSHAAIVARELKIPCIVNTSRATKALRDGDLVEVDADKGVVRILEKAS